MLSRFRLLVGLKPPMLLGLFRKRDAIPTVFQMPEKTEFVSKDGVFLRENGLHTESTHFSSMAKIAITTFCSFLTRKVSFRKSFCIFASSNLDKMNTISKAKPFIKWVGGKTQLLEQLDAQLPADFDTWDDVTYIEPFVGGGAMLFYMLQRYPNIRRAVINDINPDLTTCYRTVRDMPDELIAFLTDIQNAYNEHCM